MWGDEESNGGINVGYKPLITSWETPAVSPAPRLPIRHAKSFCHCIVGDKYEILWKSASSADTFVPPDLSWMVKETSDWLVIITSDWVVIEPGSRGRGRLSTLFKVASASVWTLWTRSYHQHPIQHISHTINLSLASSWQTSISCVEVFCKS